MFTSCKKYDECPVCFEDINQRKRAFLHLENDHCMCLECLYKLSDGKCPICQEDMYPTVIANIYISGIKKVDLIKELRVFYYENISRVGSQLKVHNIRIHPYDIKSLLIDLEKKYKNIKSYYRIK